MNIVQDQAYFFEIEGKCFTAGNRDFPLNNINTKGEDYSIAPFGIKETTFDDTPKKLMPIILSDTQYEALLKMEMQLKSKLENKCPEFMAGTQKYYSFIKELPDGKKYLNLKVNDNVKVTFFNIQKGTFKKDSIENVLPGQHVYVDLSLNHPWKTDIKGNIGYGFSFKLNEVIILSSSSQSKNTLKEKRKSIQEILGQELKKKTKMMDYKKQE
jgi:hypothetical protein